LSEKPGFQTLTANRHSDGADVVSSGRVFTTRGPRTSNREDPAADCWEPDRWYQQATRTGRAQCSSAWL